jgi:hypothetical protein
MTPEQKVLEEILATLKKMAEYLARLEAVLTR